MQSYPRRKFLRNAAVSTLGPSLVSRALGSVTDLSYEDEFPDMLVLSLARQANALAAKWDLERANIKTKEQTFARSRHVRDKVLEMLGGFPERNELHGTTTGTLQRDGYRIENVRYQSRPDFWVPGNLYIPTTGPGPFPAIVSSAGHYDDAGRVPSYQLYHMLMAQSGFVVLAYDPLGQGERRHHWNPATGRYDIGEPGIEHALFGLPLHLVGENFAMYQLWDGLRAIDYLLTRPEVDRERIGATGHSGGSWATMCIALLDDRVKCMVCNQPGTLHHWWPLDTQPNAPFRVLHPEYQILPAAWNGIDYCDIYQALAPRPMLLTGDEGLWGGYARFFLVKKHIEETYARVGAPERFATVESGDRHYMTHKMRLALTDWFSKWFCNKPGPLSEPDHEPEPVKSLHCTPGGSLRHAALGETLQGRTARKAANLPPQHAVPRSAGELENFRRPLLESVRRVLRLETPKVSLAVRRLMTVPRRGYRIERAEFLTEPDIYVPVWVMIPDGAKSPYAPLIHVSDTGRQLVPIGGESGLLEKMVRRGQCIVAVDLRGVGDTHPRRPERDGNSSFRNLVTVETSMAHLAWSMNRCLLGMRVLDLIRTVDYVASRPDLDRTRIAVLGTGGMASIWTLFAAALDPRIQTAVCEGSLLSYRTITDADRSAHPGSIYPLDGLHHFDLPQVAAAVAPRRLTLLGPVDHMHRPATPAARTAAYEFAQKTYAAAAVPGRFSFVNRRPGVELADQYLSLLANS